MRAPLLLLSLLVATPVAAQSTGAGGTGKETFQNLRSFTVRNDSKTVLASVRLISTNGGKTMFETKGPVQPYESAEAQVGRDDCLAEVDATFKDGRTLRSAGLNDCHLTRVSVGNDAIRVESAAVH